MVPEKAETTITAGTQETPTAALTILATAESAATERATETSRDPSNISQGALATSGMLGAGTPARIGL